MKAEKEQAIIILTPGFPSDESDSTCLPAQQTFLRALSTNYPSIDIKVITFHYPYRKDNYLWNGIQVLSLNGRNIKGFGRLLLWIRAWRAIKSLINKNRKAGILSFWCTECGLVGKWFAAFHNIKHYCWLLGQDAKKTNGFVKYIKPKSTELIALSPFLQHEFEANHCVRPFTVISNAIDPADYPPSEAERTIDALGVGSLIPLKQYEIFIDVIRKTVDRFPNLRAIICGKGPEQESLQQLINQYGLKKNITLVGEKSHEHVLGLMQQSKIFLHPSQYEGYSSVCLEALYAGAHVVSFRAPTSAAIDHWHVVNSQESMQEKVSELLSDSLLEHNRVLLHTAADAAKAMIRLFETT
jgi:glycosyltransferase involved in cell wall biosynthesis